MSITPTSTPLPLPRILITPSKVRAARAALGWTQIDLARAAEVSGGSIAQYETGLRAMQRPALRMIQKTLENAGVKFLPAGIEWLDGVQARAVSERPTTHPTQGVTNL